MMKNLLALFIISFMIFGVSCSSNSENKKSDTAESTETKAEVSNVKVGLNIGEKAPDLEYPSPDGELIKLSSLKGKMVLIDFWAGWCPPCRRENPNIVSTYEEFKDKAFVNGDGFTVYSVSLDATKEMWVNAIAEDNLSWRYHVSDLKYWESVPAAMYQVRGIPASWLIDGDGVIIAKNLRGEALPNTLREFLK
jgi:thiol-disulfide isomerase/thioredoxin